MFELPSYNKKLSSLETGGFWEKWQIWPFGSKTKEKERFPIPGGPGPLLPIDRASLQVGRNDFFKRKSLWGPKNKHLTERRGQKRW